VEWFLIKAVIDGLVDRSVVLRVDESFFSDELDRKVWLVLRSAFSKGLVDSWRDLYVYAIREGAHIDVLDRIEWYEQNDVEISNELVLDTISKLWKEKAVVSGIKRVEGKLLKGGDIDDVVKELKGVYRNVTECIVDSDSVYEDVFDGVFERMMNNAVEAWAGEKLLSGFLQLDIVLGGGYRSGTLTVWLGATSIGKTMMLVFQSVIFLLQGKSVLFISLEDSKDVVLERFDRVLFGNVMKDPGKLAKRVELLKMLGRVKVMYRPRMWIQELEDLIDREAGGVDVLVVDYGDLVIVSDKSRGGEDWLEQGEVFERMMKIADRYGMWVVTASQANRDAVNKKVLSLGNVGRSYRKVQVADYVIALSQDKEAEKEDLIMMVVLKNKFGRRGDVIPLRVVREYGFFREEVM
jgi:KaiC/GvpD/RAD55 family RecA-like ATPase